MDRYKSIDIDCMRIINIPLRLLRTHIVTKSCTVTNPERILRRNWVVQSDFSQTVLRERKHHPKIQPQHIRATPQSQNKLFTIIRCSIYSCQEQQTRDQILYSCNCLEIPMINMYSELKYYISVSVLHLLQITISIACQIYFLLIIISVLDIFAVKALPSAGIIPLLQMFCPNKTQDKHGFPIFPESK